MGEGYFEKYGIVSWRYQHDKPHMFEWSTVDITKQALGTTVPGIRYNKDTDMYSVWTYTVTKHSDGDYSVLKYDKLLCSGTKDITVAVNAYNTALANSGLTGEPITT